METCLSKDIIKRKKAIPKLGKNTCNAYLWQKFMYRYKEFVPRIYKGFLVSMIKRWCNFLKIGKRLEETLYKTIHMANEHLVVWETYIQTTVQWPYTPSRRAKNWKDWQSWQASKQREWPQRVDRRVDSGPFWKPVWQFLIMLNRNLHFNPTITFLGVYSREMETLVHKKTSPGTFITALCIITPNWKQPNVHQ